MSSRTSGRDLDRDIARKFFKWAVIYDGSIDDYYIIKTGNNTKTKEFLPYFSTDEDHAYMIIDYIQKKGYYCYLNSRFDEEKFDTRWYCSFLKSQNEKKKAEEGISLPHAVCLEALNFVTS